MKGKVLELQNKLDQLLGGTKEDLDKVSRIMDLLEGEKPSNLYLMGEVREEDKHNRFYTFYLLAVDLNQEIGFGFQNPITGMEMLNPSYFGFSDDDRDVIVHELGEYEVNPELIRELCEIPV